MHAACTDAQVLYTSVWQRMFNATVKQKHCPRVDKFMVDSASVLAFLFLRVHACVFGHLYTLVRVRIDACTRKFTLQTTGRT